MADLQIFFVDMWFLLTECAMVPIINVLCVVECVNGSAKTCAVVSSYYDVPECFDCQNFDMLEYIVPDQNQGVGQRSAIVYKS